MYHSRDEKCGYTIQIYHSKYTFNWFQTFIYDMVIE